MLCLVIILIAEQLSLISVFSLRLVFIQTQPSSLPYVTLYLHREFTGIREEPQRFNGAEIRDIYDDCSALNLKVIVLIKCGKL